MRVQRLINTDVWFLEILEEVTQQTRFISSIFDPICEDSILNRPFIIIIIYLFICSVKRKTCLFSLSPDVEHVCETVKDAEMAHVFFFIQHEQTSVAADPDRDLLPFFSHVRAEMCSKHFLRWFLFLVNNTNNLSAERVKGDI